MHKFHVKFSLSGGECDIFADNMEDARRNAVAEYRRNACAIDYAIENHNADQVIDTIMLVD